MLPVKSLLALIGVSAVLFNHKAVAESEGPEEMEKVDQDFMGYGARRQAYTADDFLIDLSQPPLSGPGGTIAVRTVDTTPIMGSLRNTVTNALYTLDPCGSILPHVHVGGTENIFVAKGSVKVGFVEEPPFNRLIENNVTELQAFQFPHGLVHWVENDSCEPALVHQSFPGGDPGTIVIPTTLFGLPESVLQYTFPGLDERALAEVKKSALSTSSPVLKAECVERCKHKASYDDA